LDHLTYLNPMLFLKNQLRTLIFLSEESILKSPFKISLARLNSAPSNSLDGAFHFGACDVTRDGETNSSPGNNVVMCLKKFSLQKLFKH
jgi:hypothetical protein